MASLQLAYRTGARPEARFVLRSEDWIREVEQLSAEIALTLQQEVKAAAMTIVERLHIVTAEEAENLEIRRGTLNEAERQAIEQHGTTTIRLLEQIPFPPEMRSVPFIAGAHHERLDGTGYPNRLGREQLPMQARILGLADVFEALTARDRPYKPGRTLSETLRTMQDMVDQGHLDADLHEVFLRSKIHLHCAVEHLDPHQIDGPHQAELEQLTAPWSPTLRSRSGSGSEPGSRPQGASSP